MTAAELFLRAYPTIAAAVRVRARELTIRCRLPADERQDCEQSLLLGIFQALRQYDAKKSSINTFVDRVAKRKAISLVRERGALKYRRQQQWAAEIADLLIDTAWQPDIG